MLLPIRVLLTSCVLLTAPPYVIKKSVANAEPFAQHERACVSGQMCTIVGLAGTGMGNGDTIVLLKSCGEEPMVEGMPGVLGRTLAAVDDGSKMSWGEEITPDGGEYDMCWCGASDGCSSIDSYWYSVGKMTITGPVYGNSWECVSGRLCQITGLQGEQLRNNDSVMVLDTCGVSPGVAGFPNGARSLTGWGQGSEHGWGQAKISAVGGTYSLCWCAKGYTCVEGIHHLKQIGDLVVVGPSGNFAKTCSTFETCTWAGVAGTGLANGDRMMVLEACGKGMVIPGIPNSGIAIAFDEGGSYEFGDSDNFVTSGGAEYALCWCQPGGSAPCTSPSNFIVRAGTLTVIGARSDHDVSCVREHQCRLLNFFGVGLSNNDKIKVLRECGKGVSPRGFPDDGLLIASNSGESYVSWTTPLTADYGTYRLCWCRDGWACETTSGFKMDAGVLRVVGVSSGQEKSCHVSDGCSIANFQGNNLKNGDRIKILTSCSGNGELVPGWPNNGTSGPATNSGAAFSWGLIERVRAAPGSYKMCWCPNGHPGGCKQLDDFTVEAGTMILRGPTPYSTNFTCSAYQECILGPFDVVSPAWSSGKDQIILVHENENCRDAPRDPEVGGVTYGKAVATDGLLYWDASDLPFGGVWKMCYCANYDSKLDGDNVECSSPEDFPAVLGLLAVAGAYPGQSVNCTRNQECTFSVLGEALNKDIHQIAVRDDSASCGSKVKLEDATRRRRDVIGNPYPGESRISANEIVFTVAPIQMLGTFRICFCVPPPAADRCGQTSLLDFDQLVGALDIRGASPDQSFVCGQGGFCTLTVKGRHLQETDFLKIVSMPTNCSGQAEQEGFFRSLLPADPGAREDQVNFSLGRVTASGDFKVCYCASLDGCDGMEEYNHLAGILRVLDPLGALSLQSATATSITVSVESRIENPRSEVRCAASIYEPPSKPDAASISAGLQVVGLGKGVSAPGTKNGTNIVEIFFETFVLGGQQYRVWCVETSAQSFILPDHVGGNVIITPDDIPLPRLRVYPSYLWSQANFFVELYDVFEDAIDTSESMHTTAARVTTGATASTCNEAKYDDAVPLNVTDFQSGNGGAVLVSKVTLAASQVRPYICFFAGSAATGIAMIHDPLIIRKDVPGFSQRRQDGQVTYNFYRGVLMQIVFENAAPFDGLVHWTDAAQGESCAGVNKAKTELVTGTNTSFFRFEGPVGLYTLCYLGRQSESGTIAPFNVIGTFEVTDAITAIRQDPSLPSTRNTVRIEVEVRVPGAISCLARAAAAATGPADFGEGVSYQGRAYLDVEPAPKGTDPEFPRQFKLTIPLLFYQRTVGPLHVWCHHALAEKLVFPESDEGSPILLQTQEPTAMSTPSFVWTGARFKLSLSNTPSIKSKLVAMHDAPLPTGWSREVVVGDNGAEVIRYVETSTGQNTNEHPASIAWRSGGPSPCEGGNVSEALELTQEGYTETDSWFVAKASNPFVCYWASLTSFPHLVTTLDVVAQPPEFLLEVGGQLRPYVYRGVDVTLRLKHISPSGGRILVVRQKDYDSFGGVCQDMGLNDRRLGTISEEKDLEKKRGDLSKSSLRFPHSLETEVHTASDQTQSKLAASELQMTPRVERQLTECTSSKRRTADLKLIPADRLFPTARWADPLDEGLNCTLDFNIYHNPKLPNTSILADKDRDRYFLVTSSLDILFSFFSNIRFLSQDRAVPNTSIAVVDQDFITFANATKSDWVLSTRDCDAQVLLDPENPMYEEGSESLKPAEYQQAALHLSNMDIEFLGLAYTPHDQGDQDLGGIMSVLEKAKVCKVLQPPAPPPKRPESPLDIDQPGLGRTVKDGAVWVPSKVDNKGSFLHTDPLGEYIVCYVGDGAAESPVFNPIGAPFESRDVLPASHMLPATSPQSDSLASYLNVTSMLRGVVRCLAWLRNTEYPTKPDDIFHPDKQAADFVGSSEPIQFDVPETSALMRLDLDQAKAKFIASSESFAQAKPTMYVWCAHEGSTVLYPNTPEGYKLDIQARSPPPFEYKQFNRTIRVIQLTQQLEFTELLVSFVDPLFPVNQYDEVKFTTRPMLPGGLEIDSKTGTISGRPEAAGNFTRIVVATSTNPPQAYSQVELIIDVQDVLSLRRRSVNVDHVVFTTMPRSTDLFVARELFILILPKKAKFTNQPTEFFCLGHMEQGKASGTCQKQKDACCCAAYIIQGRRVQDFRVSTKDCGLSQLAKYHAAGMVTGKLTTQDGERTTGLRSTKEADINIPEEKDADKKSPVSFDLVLKMSLDDWLSNEAAYQEQLAEELHTAVAIPKELISVGTAEPVDAQGGRRLDSALVRVIVSFSVEARCLEQRSAEVEIMSFGIDTKANCNLVAPKEYMDELRSQLTDKNSALYEDERLELLQKVSDSLSFSRMRVLWFCNKEPLWKYGAVVPTEDECPYDMLKVGAIGVIVSTVSLSFLFGALCYLSSECASCSFLYKVRILDILTPLLALFTTVGDYAWLVMIKQADGGSGDSSATKHPLFDTIFMAGLCHLLGCLCINALALRITITSYILDTPWWRRNRKRLRPVLFITMLCPRFFRITRANLFGFDSTHIHFGTPSKMSVVFSNLGIVSLFQDIPQLLMHAYVWFVWRNQGPRLSMVCFVLSVQSIVVASLHHVFSRSQRAAYERVVKLLGVRRLTAGFFDVSAGVGQGPGQGNLLDSMRVAGNTQLTTDHDGDDENMKALGDVMDPTKLDPIQAAMYVSQMYEKEARNRAKARHDTNAAAQEEEEAKDATGDEDDDDEGDAENEESEDDEEDEPEEDGGGQEEVKKEVYPKGLYEKMKAFYTEHDPKNVDNIVEGDVEVDEAKLDADLKRRFGIGLES